MMFLGALLAGTAGAILRQVCTLQAVYAEPVLLDEFETLLWNERLETAALKQEMGLLTVRALLHVLRSDVGCEAWF